MWKTWWNQDRHSLEVTTKILQNHLARNLFLQTNQKGSTLCVHTFPMVQIVRFASVRKLQRLLAHAIQKATHIFRAIKFGDIITADYKILNEEFRNNQRYAIVVQDFEENPKVMINTVNFGIWNSLKIFDGISVRFHLIGLRRMEWQERQ